MKRTPRSGYVLLLATLMVGLPSAAAGQATKPGNTDNTAFGTTSAEFLLLGAGARGTALGGSYAAVATDASALYYNPAGAALGTHPSVVVGTVDYVADTRYSWGGLAFPFGGSKAFGIQLGTFGFTDQPAPSRHQRGSEAAPQGPQLRLDHAPVAELEQADRRVGGAHDQWPDRALDPAERDDRTLLRARGRVTKQACERRAKPALRFETTAVGGL